MRKITNVFLSLVLVLCLCISAYGAPGINEGASSCTNGMFTVSGTADAGELLLLRAIKPNGSDANPADIFYAETKYASADGNFSFEFGINSGITGDYKMIVTSANASSDSYVVRGVNEADILDTIAKINSAADAAAVKAVFDNYNAAVKLSINTDIYDRINSAADYSTTFGIIFQRLYEKKTASPLGYNGTSIINLDVFQTELNKASALAYLNQENTLAALTEFEGADYFNLTRADTPSVSLDAYVADKSTVKTLVAAKDYADEAALQKSYDEKLLLAAVENNDHFQINSIVNATGVGTLLAGFTPPMGAAFRLGDYNANPSIQYTVDIAVAGKSYSTASEFVAAFNEAIPTVTPQGPGGVQNNNNNNSGNNSSSVGIGGGQAIPPYYEDKSFYDLAGYEWAKEAIEFLQGMNIISGTAPNTFSPTDFVTREQFVKMLVLLAGKYSSNAVCNFGDVPSGDWSASYIASAVDAGLVQGIDASNFGYGREISRQDACVLLARVLGTLAPGDTAIEFTDSGDISDYAKDAVELLASLGIINGMDDGSFAPLESMTRAQAAKMLYELYKIGGFANEN